MLRLAIRNVFRHTMRTTLIMTAIVFGVVILILSGGFVEDTFVQLREATIHSRLGHMQVYRKGYFDFGRRNPYEYFIEDTELVMDSVSGAPGVVEILQRLEFAGLASSGRADLPIIGEGVEPDKEARLGTFLSLASGRQLTNEDDLGILVGEGVAGALNLEPGDYLNLLVNTPEGALNSLEFEVVGVFRTFSKDYDDRAVRVSLLDAQELVVSDGVHSLVVSLEQSEATDSIAEQLRQVLSKDDFEIYTWYELADYYRQTVALYRRQFGVLQIIILVMVVLTVNSSVNMAIFERTGEFGTMMAIGDRGRDVFRLVLAESALLGLIGAIFGVVVGAALAWVISQIGIPMPPPPNANSGYTALVRIVPAVLASAFLIGAVATLLGAVIPARRASGMPIVDALRQNI